VFLIKLKHFEDEFAHRQFEFLLHSLRQMQTDVIFEISLARIGLFNASVVLEIFEKQYLPKF
jgi:hypothetical protein